MRFATWLSMVLLVASTVASAAPRRSKARGKAQLAHEPAAAVDELESESGAADADEPATYTNEEDLTDEELVEEELVVRKKSKKKSKKVGNEFYFRAGFAHVEPRIQSSGMQLEAKGILGLVPMEPVQGGVATDPTNIIAASIGFAPAVFRGYIAFETIIGVPKKAKLRATGDLANKSLAPSTGIIDTGVPPLGEELGEASAVPPMITAIFRLPALGPFRAYVGGGASVLFVRDARITNKVLTEVATPKLEIDPAWGVVAQAGVDVQIWDRFYARLDFKELWFQESETRISNIHVRTEIPLLETVEVGSGKSTAKANPIIVQLGIGANF